MKIVRSEGAVSSVFGMVLLFGIIILIGMVTVYSASAYYDMKDIPNTQKIEKAFAEFDLQTSETVLESPSVHTTEIPIMGGDIEIKGDDEAYLQSHIQVQFFDDEKLVDEIYCPMGSIEYSYRDRKVTYEAGGTWSRYPNGETLMITPPEFEYKKDTLMLPVMNIKGSSSAKGEEKVSITANSNEIPAIIYPDAAGKSTRENPIGCDEIRISIKSDLYKEWAEYANSLDLNSVRIEDENKTTIIDLKVKPHTTDSDIGVESDCGGDITYLYITKNELDATITY